MSNANAAHNENRVTIRIWCK